jgi:hypothetical protein
MGSRERAFRSCRAYPKYGMTAVIRPAEARRQASMSSSSSMRLSLTGVQVDWMMKTSDPRTTSLMVMAVSPSLNFPTTAAPSGNPIFAAISSASGRLELPAKILMSLPCKFMKHAPPAPDGGSAGWADRIRGSRAGTPDRTAPVRAPSACPAPSS